MNGNIVADKLDKVIVDLQMSDTDFGVTYHVSEAAAKEAKIFKATNMLEIISAELRAGVAAKEAKEAEKAEKEDRDIDENDPHYKGTAVGSIPALRPWER